MKHDELMAEYAPKAAQQAQERAQRPVAAHAQGKTVKQQKRAKRRGEPVAQPITTVHVPIGTRQEVFEALELLTGGNIAITSINGGKVKKGVNNGNDGKGQVSTNE